MRAELLISERLYGALLHLYPKPFRAAYGQQMRLTFRDACRAAHRKKGAAGLLALWLPTLLDLVKSALEERARQGELTMSKERLMALAGPLTILVGAVWLVPVIGDLALRSGPPRAESFWDMFLALWSLTFFLSFVLIGRIRTSGVPEEVSETRVSSELKEGFVVMMRSRPLRAVMVSLSVTMLGLGAVNVLFVPFLIDDLAVSEAFLGAIEASQVAGLVISGTLVAVLASRLRPSGLVSAGLVGLGAFIAAISGAGAVWQVMVLLFLVGICVGPVQAGANTLSQTLIEDKLRGRVGGALNTLISAANVTSMGLAGIAAAALGTRNVFLLSGCVVIGSGALAYWLFGELRGRVPEPARSEAA